ncbi:hypothetical protein SNE40_018625 [Patella caerulea]|uniref:Uncharacterized protein n=1 Tax=Patella caerulea TaxID=87958 RepID=A0AAN8J593_PATCE
MLCSKLLMCLTVLYCVPLLESVDIIPTPYPTPQPMKIELNCNPLDKYADCPHGYCCVRDEFLPTYVYCKRIGKGGEHCATRATYSDCPCTEGYGCKPNIISANFPSLYGTCTKDYNLMG